MPLLLRHDIFDAAFRCRYMPIAALYVAAAYAVAA